MAKAIGILIILLLLGCNASSYKTFELSTTKVNCRFLETVSFYCPDYECGTYYYAREHNISVIKTAANTLAKWSTTNTLANKIGTTEDDIYPYVPKYEQLEAELDTAVWQNFIRILYGIANERKKEYNDSNATKHSNKEWVIDIYSSDKDKPDGLKSTGSNFDGFEKAIDSIKAKIKEKTLLKKAEAESRLRAEYQKRFGESMTDAELSATWINFYYEKVQFPYYDFPKEYRIRVTRDITETAAKAEILPKEDIPGHKAELSMGEWLDFVHALHKCTDKWSRRYFKFSDIPASWLFETIHSYIDDGTEEPFKYKSVETEGAGNKPQNWAEFMKIMERPERQQ